MNNHRPVNLNFVRMQFPVMAIISILHRVSGVLLFLFLPISLYWLHASLASELSFAKLVRELAHPFNKFVLCVIITLSVFHGLAGIRHLIMDCGIGESKRGGRVTAWVVVIATMALTIFLIQQLW